MSAHRLIRTDGKLISESTIRDAKTLTMIPTETREHVGAGFVTWAKLAKLAKLDDG
jgi:hypothetical protein